MFTKEGPPVGRRGLGVHLVAKSSRLLAPSPIRRLVAPPGGVAPGVPLKLRPMLLADGATGEGVDTRGHRHRVRCTPGDGISVAFRGKLFGCSPAYRHGSCES